MPAVKITVEQGKIVVDPETVRADRYPPGEEVEWTCEAGRFEVEFKKNDSPFPKEHKYGAGKGTPKKSERVKPNADKKKYKYDVRVWVNDKEPPLMLDPGVEVWDSGGGGGRVGGGSSGGGTGENP